jgi:hypothetical protein
MSLSLRLAHVLGVLILAACAGSTLDVPDNVTVRATPARLPPGAAVDADADPQIRAVWLTSLTLDRGQTWSGEVSTSTNAASVEVRTDSFSFSVPRKRIGLFAFSYPIPDLPPYLRRRFVLHVVARNSAGTRTDEEIPIEIR